MSNDNTDIDSQRVTSIVKTLCEHEGDDITLRFADPLRFPSSKYDGYSYETETLPKQTLNATIERASVEYPEGILMCHVAISASELVRVGADPNTISNMGASSDDQCTVEIRAHRDMPSADDLSAESIERAVDEERQEEVFPPWEGRPTVVVTVQRTSECMKKHYESGFHLQYESPDHEIGELIDVRIKDCH